MSKRDLYIKAKGVSQPPVTITDADALAYIEAVELVDGQFLENPVRLEIEDLIVNLKAEGVWSQMVNFGILGVARTLEGALTPVKGVAPVNVSDNFIASDYNRKTGLKGDGASKRLLLNKFTDFSTSANNNNHLFTFISENATSGGWYMNDNIGSAGTMGIGNSAGLSYVVRNQNSTSDTLISLLSTPAFFATARSASGSYRWLINQGSNTAITRTSQTLTNERVGVFCDGTGSNFSDARLFCYSMGFNLTGAIILEARTIIENFYNNIQTLLSDSPPPPPQDFDVIFIAGQSNADGRVVFSDSNTPQYISNGLLKKANNENIKVWNGTSISNYNFALRGSTANGNQWVDALSPVERWSQNHVAVQQIANYSTNPILIVQVSEGGTQVSKLPRQTNNKGSWNVDFANIFSGGVPLLLRMKERYDALKSFALANNITLNPKAVLWHQGEADYDVSINPNITAGERQSALDNFEADMIDIIDYFRDDIADNPDLLFLYGTVKSTSTKFSSQIQTAHLNIAANDPKAFVLNTNELAFFDGLHFNGWSNVVFGNWLAVKYFENQ